MSADTPESEGGEQDHAPAAKIERQPVDAEMEQSYLDYSMSVIAGRALPDVRDGLKPVHRRILYAMSEEGLSSNSGHRKSSSIVGETMGNFHPHGESAIYDALVRMAQNFSMRHCLVDGQGNFGSIDGDPAAAMRYTESRMTPIAEELLEDIDKNTVSFQPNYDDRMEEPEVLPSKYPNLLVNGSSGIAVGMSTNIPPHNLGEIVDATIELIENPEATVEDLMEHVPGPDFPTGAQIVGRDGIYSAYKTGKGRLRLRSEFHVEDEGSGKDQIIITELPYQQNKSKLIENIADDVNDGKIEGISDIRDESDRDGIRVAVDVKAKAMTNVVKNKLQSNHLERTFGVINLALVDGQPRVLSLKETLEYFISHRKEVVRNRSKSELADAEERAEVLEGRLKALEVAEEIVELIQGSDDRSEARNRLEEKYEFSERQSKHIVSMQLGSLTSMESGEIKDEYESVTDRIDFLNSVLADAEKLTGLVKDELREIKDEYADERRTTIVEDAGSVKHEDLIPEKEIGVTLTNDGYVKRVPLTEFSSQHRGGKGVIGSDLKDDDHIVDVFAVNTHDYLLCFTDKGQVYELRGYEVPEFGRTSLGKHVRNILSLDDDEQVVEMVSVDDMEEVNGDYITIATANGYIKRSELAEFDNIRSVGIRAVSIEDGDELVGAAVTDGCRDFVMTSRNGRAIRFPEDEVRSMGRTARGVVGMKLEAGDSVISLSDAPSNGEGTLLSVTDNGFGKRTDLSEYKRQSRAGKGVLDVDTGSRNGPATGSLVVSSDEELVMMTGDGMLIRMPTDEIPSVGRNTKGVNLMDLTEGDTLASLSITDSDEH